MSDSVENGWQPVRRLRTHEHVLEQIQKQISSGRLGPGDRLPGERELAEYLDVGRAGVREALRVLEAMGVITAGVGSGPSAGSVVSASGRSAMANLLRLHLALARFTQREVMEVRVQLERWAVSEAAGRAREADIASLRAVLLRMRQPEIGYEEFNEYDTSFHVTLANMCGNALLAELMGALRDVLKREMVAVFENLQDWRATAVGLIEEHQEIVDAIEAGDAHRAASTVERHIADFYVLTDAHH